MASYKNKMTFEEFIHFSSKDISPMQARLMVYDLLRPESKHEGDCTECPCTCDICLLQNYLDKYEKYFFNGEDK